MHGLKAARVCALMALLAAAVSHADVRVPAGAQWELGDATLNLAGGSLIVGGRFVLRGGRVDAASGVDLAAGSRLDAGAGMLRVAGPWRNLGQFDAGTSRVEFFDGGLASADVTGSTRFHQAAWDSSSGKTWRFAAGSTQTFANRLEIHGQPALPIRMTSDAPGQLAYFDLLSSATQDIANVAVTDIQATGQHLAPDQSNQGGGNAPGWFGTLQPIPALSWPMLVLLVAGFFLFALRSRRA
jgi:hypothetical protein